MRNHLKVDADLPQALDPRELASDFIQVHDLHFDRAIRRAEDDFLLGCGAVLRFDVLGPERVQERPTVAYGG